MTEASTKKYTLVCFNNYAVIFWRMTIEESIRTYRFDRWLRKVSDNTFHGYLMSPGF